MESQSVPVIHSDSEWSPIGKVGECKDLHNAYLLPKGVSILLMNLYDCAILVHTCTTTANICSLQEPHLSPMLFNCNCFHSTYSQYSFPESPEAQVLFMHPKLPALVAKNPHVSHSSVLCVSFILRIPLSYLLSPCLL